jgi:phosphoribosylformylglycinamidine synthase
MWQLSEAVDGMGEACRALSLPVVGGNVSLYNESRGSDIDPTPIVAAVGLIDRLSTPPPGARLVDGTTVLLLGPSAGLTLSGSRWAWGQGHRRGTPPALDLADHRKVCELVRSLVADGLVAAVHDTADGGVGLALAEMAVQGGVGVEAVPPGGADHRWLFAESPSRFVLCVTAGQHDEVARRCAAAGVPVASLGRAGGDRITIGDLVDVPLSVAIAAWKGRLPELLGQGTTQG